MIIASFLCDAHSTGEAYRLPANTDKTTILHAVAKKSVSLRHTVRPCTTSY